MNTPLYARMNEFAPVPSGKSGADALDAASHEASHAASQESTHEGSQEAGDDESGPHGSLFEQCSPQVGKFLAKAGEDDATAARGVMASQSELTADVPELKISSALDEGSLTDGYKLHEVALFDSGSFDEKTMSAGASSVATKDFAQPSPVQSNDVPGLELDFSGAPEAKLA